MTLADDEVMHQVNAELVRSLGELATSPAQEWAGQLAGMCERLSVLHRPEQVLPAMVWASAVIQQFLLELATRPSAGYPVHAVVDKAGWVLAGRRPTVRPHE